MFLNLQEAEINYAEMFISEPTMFINYDVVNMEHENW